MKRLTSIFSALVFVLAFSSLGAFAQEQMGQEKHDMSKEESFGIKAYDHFHHQLHPLQHEALPNKDFKTMRVKAAKLVLAANAIVRMGTPRSVKDRKQFRADYIEFRKAISDFSKKSKTGTDDELAAAFTVVHDSFEKLGDQLKKKE